MTGSAPEGSGPDGAAPGTSEVRVGSLRERLAAAGRRAWPVVRGLPVTVLVLLVRAYQLVLSPMTPPSCRYHPSCSSYAITALRRHGVVRGLGLTAWRLLRCNPWTPGGVDDVPPARTRGRGDAILSAAHCSTTTDAPTADHGPVGTPCTGATRPAPRARTAAAR